MDAELVEMIVANLELADIGILILALNHCEPEARTFVEHAIAHRFAAGV
jgi:hypothetical protein